MNIANHITKKGLPPTAIKLLDKMSDEKQEQFLNKVSNYKKTEPIEQNSYIGEKQFIYSENCANMMQSIMKKETKYVLK